jgi:hypothetical protein
MKYYSRDIFFTVESQRESVGVTETVVGVGGGDVGGVLDFTSRSLFAGPIFIYATWQRILIEIAQFMVHIQSCPYLNC